MLPVFSDLGEYRPFHLYSTCVKGFVIYGIIVVVYNFLAVYLRD